MFDLGIHTVYIQYIQYKVLIATTDQRKYTIYTRFRYIKINAVFEKQKQFL